MDLIIGTLVICILLGHAETKTTFDEYLDSAACNHTITLGSQTGGGTAEFEKMVLSPATIFCTVRLHAPSDHYISVKTTRKRSPPGVCDVTVTIDNSTDTFVNCNESSQEITSYNASMTLTYVSSTMNDSYVRFIFYTYREGHCSDSEEECENHQPTRCLQEDIACLNPHSICGDEDHCEDEIPTTTIVLATVASLVVLIVAFIVIMVVHVRVCSRRKTQPLPVPTRPESDEHHRRSRPPRSATSINFRVSNRPTSENDRMSPPPPYSVAIANHDGVPQYQHSTHNRTTTDTYIAPPSFRDAPPSYDEVIRAQEQPPQLEV